MRRKWLMLAVAVVGSMAGAGEAPPVPRVPVESAALDLMDGYWRYHLTFSAARVSPAELANLGVDTTKPRLDRPFYYDLGWYSGHGGSTELAYLIESAPPPPDWVKPQFDDSVWPRRKKPFLIGGASHIGLAVGLACFRTCVWVEDPERVKGLNLELTYRGGVVVYVNGQEMVRGHLPALSPSNGPKGEIKPDTSGEDYPLEAYVLEPEEFWTLKPERPRAIPDLRGTFPGPGGFVRDRAKEGKINPRFSPEDLTSFYPAPGGDYVHLSRQEWSEVQGLRDRQLGPVEIPKGFLRKGPNVIAVEVHRSDLNPVVHDGKRLGTSSHGWGYFGGTIWMHGLLKSAKITSDPPGAVLAEARPAETQVWIEDIHRRCFSPEFGPAGQASAPLRLVGARNGSYSGQVVLGVSAASGDVKASASDLTRAGLPDAPRQAGGGKVPAGAVSVRYGVPLPVVQLAALGADRGGSRWRVPEKSGYVIDAVETYGPKGASKDGTLFSQAMSEIAFFDQLSPTAPKRVPANSCLPVWVTVKVPQDAQPGEYRGELSIGAGGATAKVPLRLWVMDWALPDPADFKTVMALEQSPYGVAAHYKVPLWSDQHFKLMENSFRLLAEIGNDYLVIPVLTGSEFGNREDSMIRWVRGSGGPPAAAAQAGVYECDFSVLDRYLRLACKYVKPRCVCFVVAHAADNSLFVKPRVLLKDGDHVSPVDVPEPGTEEAKAFWRPLVEGVRKRLADRGLDQALHWGFYWDYIDHDKTRGYGSAMINLLAELAPGVGWARGCHMSRKGGKDKDAFTFVSTIYDLPSPHQHDKATGRLGVLSHKGWKNPMLHLVLPRVVNNVITVEGPSPPFVYRMAPERAIVCGARGVARVGADYWAETYQSGWCGPGQVGMPVTAVFWPGENGAEAGARFECLREGIQETEARIFLENTLEGPGAGAPPLKAAQEILDQRIQATLHIPPAFSEPRVSEYCGGWQERSWDLYAAAAAGGGGRAPSDAEKKAFFDR
ncbi:MAG: glycoside hydrolase domain-containing protein [Planctomycetota bacterium]